MTKTKHIMRENHKVKERLDVSETLKEELQLNLDRANYKLDQMQSEESQLETEILTARNEFTEKEQISENISTGLKEENHGLKQKLNKKKVTLRAN